MQKIVIQATGNIKMEKMQKRKQKLISREHRSSRTNCNRKERYLAGRGTVHPSSSSATFLRDVLPPSSGLTSNPSRQQAQLWLLKVEAG
jgi:hypothetical protein